MELEVLNLLCLHGWVSFGCCDSLTAYTRAPRMQTHRGNWRRGAPRFEECWYFGTVAASAEFCRHELAEDNLMSDNKGMRNSPDNRRIDLDDRHEVRNWATSLNVSEEELRRAVEKVGTSAERVREHLRTTH